MQHPPKAEGATISLPIGHYQAFAVTPDRFRRCQEVHLIAGGASCTADLAAAENMTCKVSVRSGAAPVVGARVIAKPVDVSDQVARAGMTFSQTDDQGCVTLMLRQDLRYSIHATHRDAGNHCVLLDPMAVSGEKEVHMTLQPRVSVTLLATGGGLADNTHDAGATEFLLIGPGQPVNASRGFEACLFADVQRGYYTVLARRGLAYGEWQGQIEIGDNRVCVPMTTAITFEVDVRDAAQWTSLELRNPKWPPEVAKRWSTRIDGDGTHRVFGACLTEAEIVAHGPKPTTFAVRAHERAELRRN